jgi:hypothetical protein
MKFAVVEYNSKSGGIWRHTKARPNYVADPKTEIDPTSFGCYVSALAGEHIPLKGLIVGPVNKVAKPVQTYRKAVKRLTGSWPAYDIEYLRHFDALLVVHQLSDAHEMVRLAQRLKVLEKRPLLVGVPTQPYGILKPALDSNPKAKQNFVDFMDACDVFVSVVDSTTQWYQDQTKTPVRYLPQPYPVSYAAKYLVPRPQKDKTLLVAGVTQRPNVAQGQVIARELQKKFPEYTITIPKVAEYDYDFSELKDARYTVLPFEQWQQHLTTLAKTTLVINTDYTQTRGRVQTDCAAVGTPSLGGNSDGTADLFPELLSDPATATEKLIAQGERLLTDTAYYDQIAAHARQALQKYDYEQSAARLRDIVNQS